MVTLPDHEFRKWMEDGRYLPPPLRDFHDQKDVFKAIHEIVSANEGTKRVNWVDAQIYTVDVFLWFMARRGYTLQRSRLRYDFRDLDEDVQQQNSKRDQQFHSILAESLSTTHQANTAAQSSIEGSAGE